MYFGFLIHLFEMFPFCLLSSLCCLSHIVLDIFVLRFLNLILEFGVGLAANPMAKDHTEPRAKEEHFSEQENGDCTITITVVGASGDLAKKKIFPALFALYYDDYLPKVLICVSY